MKAPFSSSHVSWLPTRFGPWWETEKREEERNHGICPYVCLGQCLWQWLHLLYSALAGSSLFPLSQLLPCGPNPWIQEHGYPPLSFWPRIGRYFLLLMCSWVALLSFVWLLSNSITCLVDTMALYPYPLGVYLYQPKAASWNAWDHWPSLLLAIGACWTCVQSKLEN